ncbi:MAG TPA: bifunctional proline dehydrogenase/L-glutamate gamma-semialdehyde dehydrogenase PutA [Xanthobacteraceae bacterium]|nr:bifunctional proline dehydrogenase/L-glutamate gamma-semialdehyde dehydrogenase PutA [Xanthobacteraceae bacterium]
MTADALRRSVDEGPAIPAFAAPYAPADEEIARTLLAEASLGAAVEAGIDARAVKLVEAVRARAGGLGGIEDFLNEYSLSTREGLALMVLAEALLRVPNTATADRLIEDKLAAGDWSRHDVRSHALLVSASAWALGISARIIHPGETPEGIVESLAKRLGLPAVRAAVRQAMRLLGSHFVLGPTIEEALARAASRPAFRYSFDMLGEGARTAADAARYFDAYAHAIAAIGASARGTLPDRPGISIKLSALHPRYEPLARERVLAELTPRLLILARHAKAHDLNLTVDAEEADRLELSLELIAAVLADPSLRGWDGFGLAVQAYQKRAPEVIDWIIAAAQACNARVMVRLAKGAYWDTEIKRAQERGLSDYPVFTRKAMTDLAYMACARKLLAARPRVFPQFATHNALTVASVIGEAGGVAGYEFQRLHGMGQALYDALMADEPGTACRVYAPVGEHRDLLAYLVRRLLENGANSSFVSVAADPSVPIAEILRRPQAQIGDAGHARHPRIVRPGDLYAPARRNSAGIEFGDRAALTALLADIRAGAPTHAQAAPVIDGARVEGPGRAVTSPIDGSIVGSVSEGDDATVTAAIDAAAAGFPAWAATPVAQRAAALERAADFIEARRGALIALLAREGGKTLADAVAEVREAVDLCRFYAAQARDVLAPEEMPGPTGETNELRYRGRGVFACISPWNFPLAIFIGQVAAALVAGNSVVAKPAEQSPLIAAEALRLLHAAGVPAHALHLVPGDGRIGARILADRRVAGVAFTGSTEVAGTIATALASRNGAIVPLIAETGGINAMIVDATALPEQVTDDVIASAFRSAGQRCSSLRLLCVQDDVADAMLAMIEGAAATLVLGDPRASETDVGPVIDADAKARLDRWIADQEARGRVRFRWDRDRPLPPAGTYVAPALIDLDRAADLREEVFGPILHVVRWPADGLDRLLDDIAASGFGLTLGIHSRIDSTVARVVARLATGNVYVNRNMIGAVVGTQPFGGCGLSGTGPKAGGPNYLRRFASEQTVTINVSAIGGNASLLATED